MSSFIDPTSGAVEHLESMATQYPDLGEDYQEISRLVQGKLWHQLTLKVLELFQDTTKMRTSSNASENSLLSLYKHVVLAVAKKLHPLSLARMASHVSLSLLEADGTASKALLEELLKDESDIKLGTAATVYTQSQLGWMQLWLLEKKGTPCDMAALKAQLQTNESLLQELEFSQDSEGIVHSAHYQCSMTYRKAVGPPEAYYQQALSYLNYTPLDQTKDKNQLAVDLSLAALTGEGVFSLTEVVDTPLLQSLQNTSQEWLLELLTAASHGSVTQFRDLSQKFAAQIQQEPALVHRAAAVQEKITLLALVHMVFERPSSERTLGFADIATRLQIAPDQVEVVLMRALSLHLIEGTIDQVDEEVQVTWVLPRVLSKAQMKDLGQRFGEWAVKVSQQRDTMKGQTTLLA